MHIRRTIYAVHITRYAVQITMYYILHCMPYKLQCTAYIVHCKAYIVYCTYYTVCRTYYTVRCTYYTLRRTYYTVCRTSYMVYLYRLLYINMQHISKHTLSIFTLLNFTISRWVNGFHNIAILHYFSYFNIISHWVNLDLKLIINLLPLFK